MLKLFIILVSILGLSKVVFATVSENNSDLSVPAVTNEIIKDLEVQEEDEEAVTVEKETKKELKKETKKNSKEGKKKKSREEKGK